MTERDHIDYAIQMLEGFKKDHLELKEELRKSKKREAELRNRILSDDAVDIKEVLAHNLISLREKAGLSTYDLAEMSGVGESTIRRVEKGNRDTTAGTVEALANGLGTTSSRLLRY